MHESRDPTSERARRSLCPSPELAPRNPLQGHGPTEASSLQSSSNTNGYPNVPSAEPQALNTGTSGTSVQSYEFRYYKLLGPNHGAELPPRTHPYGIEFVFEDPLNTRTYRDTTIRTQHEIDDLKETHRQLKDFGGSCLWCYRNKKKCEPAHPCTPCSVNWRRCIRSSEELCLLAPATSSKESLAMQPPSIAAIDALQHFRQKVFDQMMTASVQIYLRRPGDDGLEAWCMDLTKQDLDVPKSMDQTVEEFYTKANAYVRFHQLATIQKAYGRHPLVRTVLKSVLSFITMSCLTGTRIHMHFSETHAAKLTIFLILAVGSRILAETTEAFCADLCDALRRKDLHDSWSHGKYRPQAERPLNPLWVATALYYRMVCGLLELAPDSPVVTIFGSTETHLVCLRNTLWGILKCIPMDNVNDSKRMFKRNLKKTIDEELPILSLGRHFDVAFCLGPTDSPDEFASLMMPRKQSGSFSQNGYDIKPLLLDTFFQSASPSNASQQNRSNPSSSQTPMTSLPTASSSSSINELSDFPSLDTPPELKNIDLFNPLPTAFWGFADSPGCFAHVDE